MLFNFFRCLQADMLEPASRPLLCHSSQAKREEYNVGCCSNEDGCNANLSVPLFLERKQNKTATGKNKTYICMITVEENLT